MQVIECYLTYFKEVKMQARAAKDNALKAIRSTNDNSEDVKLAEDSQSGNTFTVPIVSQNAPQGCSLDLFKHYKRKIEFSERELIRIHDKNINTENKGSSDKGLVYVDFNAGMFEVLKLNFLDCLNLHFNVKLLADPKIEYYGEALERVCLDLNMRVSEHSHDVKVKVPNTKCILDVAGFHDEVGKRFPHLFNLTVGKYFANHIITKIVDRINDNVDISKLNDFLRIMATEGKNVARGKSKARRVCTTCSKSPKNSPRLICKNCCEYFHVSCLPQVLSNKKQLAIQKDFTCGNCQIYPHRSVQKDDDPIQQLTDLKLSTILPSMPSSNLDINYVSSENVSSSLAIEHNAGEVSTPDEPSKVLHDFPETQNELCNDKKDVNEPSTSNHEFICIECGFPFTSETSLAEHLSSVHDKRGTKRYRPETSLVFDERSCVKCEQYSNENDRLKAQIGSVHATLEKE